MMEWRAGIGKLTHSDLDLLFFSKSMVTRHAVGAFTTSLDHAPTALCW